MVAVACFFPGRARDLSAPRYGLSRRDEQETNLLSLPEMELRILGRTVRSDVTVPSAASWHCALQAMFFAAIEHSREKCVVRRFRRCANVTKYISTNQFSIV